jgi:hypothetical protein
MEVDITTKAEDNRSALSVPAVDGLNFSVFA